MSRYELECEARLEAKEAFLDHVQEELEKLELESEGGKLTVQQVMELLEDIA